MIHHKVEQNTDEWHALRKGKLTSSSLGKLMANYGKAFGEPAKLLANKIIGEQISNKVDESITYSDMQRGHEEEPIARIKYEQDFFCSVDDGGFFENEFIGGSPDGLVYEEGLIEIKSVIASTHIKNIIRQSYDPAYKWQIMGNLKITKREWIDFISYCSSFPRDKQLFVVRINKDSKETKECFEMIDNRVEQFRILLERQKEIIMNSDLYINKD